LAELHPTGPLLRNRSGNPWTRHTLAHRFARLRRQLGLGKEATAKAFRHGFGTDGLEKGIPIATMAELMGHRSTKMLERHYSKLTPRSPIVGKSTRRLADHRAHRKAAIVRIEQPRIPVSIRNQTPRLSRP
jgi:integrase